MNKVAQHTLLLLAFGTAPLYAAQADIVQAPKPNTVTGIQNNSILLNGTWDFDMTPSANFEKGNYTPANGWDPIKVPGECAMQGYAIEHDKPVLYRKNVFVPAAFKGNKIILRFDGVYSYARLYVNGKLVRDHNGGFTRWESDITDFVKTNANNEIKLEVTDKLDEISYGSGYAHHPIGGILRDVTIYSIPKEHIDYFTVETQLDSTYTHSDLQIRFTGNFTPDHTVEFLLTDPQGKAVSLQEATASNVHKNDTTTKVFKLSNPQKWDAEHPNLYKLTTTVKKGGKPTYQFNKNVGFRKIEIEKNRMFVNGKQVKLRGACRHDIHPTLGRTTTVALDSMDAHIFKAANMNHVRTSHYPPTEAFLDFCDKLGLYVECETAICFVDTHRQKNYGAAASQDDPAYTDKYMGQLQEMVTSFRNHPSILFWSVGNECKYGSNFQKSYDWIKAEDPTRPAIFSYPGTVEKGKFVYDILSMHYPYVDGNLSQWGVSTTNFETANYPSTFDEWAHVPCYTYSTLQEDPNIREFWGQSLDMMWSKLFDRPGGLGGAIWGFIDETFMVPQPKKGQPWWIEFAHTAKPADYKGNCVGYGEWGIIDVWRREKPEFWGTKKAYSPVRVLETTVQEFTPGVAINLPVYNRFDHTNLNELVVSYQLNNGKEQPIQAPAIDVKQKGFVTVPAQNWRNGDELTVFFKDKNNQLIDAETITIGTKPALLNARRGTPFTAEETAQEIIISNGAQRFPFSKATGLITNATSNGKVVLEEGPFLNFDVNFNHLTGAEVREKARNYVAARNEWKKDSLYVTQTNGTLQVHIVGKVDKADVTYICSFAPNGTMTVNYVLNNQPNGYLREAGLQFMLPESYNKVKWNRDAYWTYYPANSFGAPKGEAPFYNTKLVKYGQDPAQLWEQDTHNYYYFADKGTNDKQPLTNIAKSMKENIFLYTLSGDKGTPQLSVVSPEGTLACRVNKDKQENLVLYINNKWDYPEIAWGNYCKIVEASPLAGQATLQF